MNPLEFKECATCSAKPGSPELCASCLHNRTAIERLKHARSASEEASIIIRKEGKPVMMIMRENGDVEYFKMKKASYADHVELHVPHV